MTGDSGKLLKWAKNFSKKRYAIDLFVSSPALRAKTTAELFAAEYDRKMKEILFVPSLYHADPENFLEVVRKLDDQYDHVALVLPQSGNY